MREDGGVTDDPFRGSFLAKSSMEESRVCDDFQVVVTPIGGNRLHLRATGAAGEATVEVAPDLTGNQMPGWLAEYRAAVENTSTLAGSDGGAEGGSRSSERSLEALGRELFDLLFPAPVSKLWHECLGRAGQAEHDLRLRIHLDLSRPESAWLAALPWEILHHDDCGGFLGQRPETPVVRYLDLRRDRRPFPRARPWRLLVVTPEPFGTPRLDVEREREDLERLWDADGRVQLVFPERSTYEAIRDELRRGPIHGVHFMGHGTYDERADAGGLILESETGGPYPVLGEGLVGLFHCASGQGLTPALCVLNGCQTGRHGGAGGEKAFAGAAAALMKAGVGAVVAMQAPIPDRTAIDFSRTLYRALQDGYPIDAAVSEARQVLAQGIGDPAWSVPALYLRVADGQLFEQAGEGTDELQPPPRERSRVYQKIRDVRGGTIEQIGHDGVEQGGTVAHGVDQEHVFRDVSDTTIRQIGVRYREDS